MHCKAQTMVPMDVNCCGGGSQWCVARRHIIRQTGEAMQLLQVASAAAANVDVANAVAVKDSAKDAPAFQQTAAKAAAAKAVRGVAVKDVKDAAAKGVRAMAAKVVAARVVAVKVVVAKVARTKGVAVKVAPARGVAAKGAAVKGAAARAVVARDAKGVDVADVALDVWATWAVEWAKRNRSACLEWVCTSDSRHV